MSRQSSVAGRKVAQARGGRAGAAAEVPFLVLDLGRGCDPHHQAAAHGHRRSARQGRLRLLARRAR